MKNLYTTVILLLCLTAGCQKKDSTTEEEQYTKAIDAIPSSRNKDWVVVLPGLGCHGCIQEGELFMQQYIEDKSILFVLTKIESIKILKQKIGIRLNGRDNIYIDRNGLFDISTQNSVYPCIIEMKNGAISKFGFQSPVNSTAFEQLKTKI